jgi:hypothetical protein
MSVKDRILQTELQWERCVYNLMCTDVLASPRENLYIDLSAERAEFDVKLFNAETAVG